MLLRDCATHELSIFTLCESIILGLNELPGNEGERLPFNKPLLSRVVRRQPRKTSKCDPPRATWRKTSGGVPLETRHLCELTTSASGLVVYQPVFMCHGCIGVFRVSSMLTAGLYPSTVPLAPRLLHVRHRRWNALRGLLACCRLRGARRLKLPGSSWRCWPKLGPQISSSLAVSVSGVKASCCAFSKMSKYIALCFLQWFSEKAQFE